MFFGIPENNLQILKEAYGDLEDGHRRLNTDFNHAIDLGNLDDASASLAGLKDILNEFKATLLLFLSLAHP